MYLPRLATRPCLSGTSNQRTATGLTLFLAAAYCDALPRLLETLGANAVTGEPCYLDSCIDASAYECHAVARWCHVQCGKPSRKRPEALTAWWHSIKVPSHMSFARLFTELGIHRRLTGRKFHSAVPDAFKGYATYLDQTYRGSLEDVLQQLTRYRANKTLVSRDRMRKTDQKREGVKSSI